MEFTDATARWLGNAAIGLAAAVFVAFPLQVKYQAPDASMVEIYRVLWDCIDDIRKSPPKKHKLITTEELSERLRSSEPPLVVDTRPEYEYRNAHIAGAVLIPFNRFRTEFDRLPRNRAIVVTCHFGKYSVVAANKLTQAGYERVYDYAAGMEEWNRLKKPVAKGMPEDTLQQTGLAKTAAFDWARGSDGDKRTVSLDYNATTPLDPRVLDCMMPFLTNKFGNAASLTHSFGTDAERAVHDAREKVASAIGAASSKEIVFTSGATESNNLAIKGIARRLKSKGNHIITCVTEHKAVLDPCESLERQGFDVTRLGAGEDGLIRIEDLVEAVRPTTILVSVMLANNEIGVVQPFRQIGELCDERGIVYHTDGTQGVGKVALDVLADKIDLMSISAHKIYGPKGAGALYVRSSVELESQIDGGGHEFGMRSGTLNVPGIVGLGECCRIAVQTREQENMRIQALRDRLLHKVRTSVSNCKVNGSMVHRLAGNLHMSFEGVTSEQVIMELNDLAISSGSACNSRRTGPSHVVKAIGIGPEFIDCTLRFGVGRFSTQEDIDFAANRLITVIRELREANKA